MTQSLSTIELNEILTQDVDSVLNWLKMIGSGNSTAPRGFNWHGLAEAAAFNAREGIARHRLLALSQKAVCRNPRPLNIKGLCCRVVPRATRVIV